MMSRKSVSDSDELESHPMISHTKTDIDHNANYGHTTTHITPLTPSCGGAPSSNESKRTGAAGLPPKLPTWEMGLYTAYISGCFVGAFYHLYHSSTGMQHDDKQNIHLKEGWALFGRKQDTADYEWTLWRTVYVKLFAMMICHVVTSFLVTKYAYKYRRHAWLTFGVGGMVYLLGYGPVIFVTAVTTSVFVAALSGSVKVTWAVGLCWLTALNSGNADWLIHFMYDIVGQDNTKFGLLYFSVAFLILRLISFGVEKAKRINGSNDLGERITFSVFDAFVYTFYFPNFYTGPVFIYKYFQSEITKPHTPWTHSQITHLIKKVTHSLLWMVILNVAYFSCYLCMLNPRNMPLRQITKPYTPWTLSQITDLIQKVTRSLFWMVILDMLLCLVYVHSMSLYTDVLHRLPLWSLGGIVMYFPAFYQTKYVVAYGLAGCGMLADQITPPRNPQCVVRVVYFSEYWRYFDPGLHAFFRNYIYIPLGGSRHGPLRQMFATVMTFTFVFFWHGGELYLYVWAMVNCVAVGIEITASKFVKIPAVAEFQDRYIGRALTRRLHAALNVPLYMASTFAIMTFYTNLTNGRVFLDRLILNSNPVSMVTMYSFVFSVTMFSQEIRRREDVAEARSSHKIL